MVILSQYPHYMYVKTCEAATVASNGDYVPGTSKWVLWSRCREETNGKGTEISTSDIKSYVFSSLIQCPVGTPKVEEGLMVLVSDDTLDPDGIDAGYIRVLHLKNGLVYDDNGNLIRTTTSTDESSVRIMGKCAKFDDGRLHCRLWL